MQIDFAVRDDRVEPPCGSGWVFGTFIYGGGEVPVKGKGWRNVAPVGLAWGNNSDPESCTGKVVEQSWINKPVRVRHLGYEGRLNGPVDNRISSCISCHATAQERDSADELDGALAPWGGVDPTPWFKNYGPGERFHKDYESLDYSLQLAYGIAGFRTAQNIYALEWAQNLLSGIEFPQPSPGDPDAGSFKFEGTETRTHDELQAEIDALLREWDQIGRGGH